MSIEVAKYVRIAISSLKEPLQLTVTEATELRDALINVLPLPSKYQGPISSTGKWILTGTTWRKGTRVLSQKAIQAVLNVIGKDWKFVDDLCDITGRSRHVIGTVISVLVQERKMEKRGWGKELKVRLRTIEYKPTLPDVPKIDVDDKGHDLSALAKEQELRRIAMREQ